MPWDPPPDTQPGKEGKGRGTRPAVEEAWGLRVQCPPRHSHTNRTLHSLNNVNRQPRHRESVGMGAMGMGRMRASREWAYSTTLLDHSQCGAADWIGMPASPHPPQGHPWPATARPEPATSITLDLVLTTMCPTTPCPPPPPRLKEWPQKGIAAVQTAAYQHNTE